LITGYNPKREHANTAVVEASQAAARSWRSESARESDRDWA
jgi:hypothetical protein